MYIPSIEQREFGNFGKFVRQMGRGRNPKTTRLQTYQPKPQKIQQPRIQPKPQPQQVIQPKPQSQPQVVQQPQIQQTQLQQPQQQSGGFLSGLKNKLNKFGQDTKSWFNDLGKTDSQRILEAKKPGSFAATGGTGTQAVRAKTGFTASEMNDPELASLAEHSMGGFGQSLGGGNPINFGRNMGDGIVSTGNALAATNGGGHVRRSGLFRRRWSDIEEEEELLRLFTELEKEKARYYMWYYNM